MARAVTFPQDPWRASRPRSAVAALRAETAGRPLDGPPFSTFRFHGPHRVWIRFGSFLPLLMPTAGWKIRTAAAAAAGQTITRTTDEANLFIRIGYL